MIKVNRHHIEYEGKKSELCTEITMLLNELVDDKVLDKDDLNLIVELAMKPRKELEEEALSHLMLLAAIDATIGGNDEMADFLDKLLKGKDDERKS